MLDRLEVFCRVWFFSAFKFACFDVCQFYWLVCAMFVRYRTGVLNFWAADPHYHLWYYPYSNRCRNPQCRITQPGNIGVFLLLMINCNSWTANSMKNEYIAVCGRRDTYSFMILTVNTSVYISVYTVRYVITAAWWKETTLMILGSIFKRKPFAIVMQSDSLAHLVPSGPAQGLLYPFYVSMVLNCLCLLIL